MHLVSMLTALLQTAVLTASTATPMPARLIELGERNLQQLQLLTREVEAAGGWWLELEQQLLLAAPAPQLEALSAGLVVSQELPDLSPQSLALQTVACGVDSRAQLPAIAIAGRFALVWAPRRFVGYAIPDSSEWQPVHANQVLARDQSTRGPTPSRGSADPAILQRVQALDTQRWFEAVESLASFNRSSYGNGIDLARDWLADRFETAGLQVELQSFTFVGPLFSPTVENVIARLPGTDLSDEWLVIGGHYDSRNSSITETANTPGAEDNASGCAGVLELARVFSTFQQRRTLVFACFAGEEQGLHGGHAFAQKLLNEGDLGRVRMAVIMDMIGYSGDADLDVLLETSAAHSAIFSRFIAMAPTYAPELRIVTSTTPCCSDHMPFINRGAPALLTIENDWNPNFANGYLHYHQTTDIPANMTRAQEMGGAIMKLNIAVIAEAAGITLPPLFRDGFE